MLLAGDVSTILSSGGYISIDIDLHCVDGVAIKTDRNTLTVSPEVRAQLRAFCLLFMGHLASTIRRRRPGTALAEQMEELEEQVRTTEAAVA